VKACEDYEVLTQEDNAPTTSSHDGANSNPTQRSDVSALSHQLGVRLLEGISGSDRASILSAASWRQFSKNMVATSQGEPANQLFLLVKGSARFFFLTRKGQKVYLIWLKHGDIFGGASLLINLSPHLASTEITKGSRVFVWQRDVIRGLVTRFPRLLENALSIASDYMTWYMATHLCLVANTAHERLAHVLLSLADGIGKKESDGIHLTITNEQLANTANISIFTASRLLSVWQQKHVVAKRRSQIILRAPDQLLAG
jgi:CRP-like cAMP-binding protein